LKFATTGRSQIERTTISETRSPQPSSEASQQLPIPRTARRSYKILSAPQAVIIDTGTDISASGRAEAAFKSEFSKWQVKIDALLKDKSLSRAQRDGALRQLLSKQQIEANGARRRVLEEEAQERKARRRINHPTSPTTPTLTHS
jgi:hypothetical protein